VVPFKVALAAQLVQDVDDPEHVAHPALHAVHTTAALVSLSYLPAGHTHELPSSTAPLPAAQDKQLEGDPIQLVHEASQETHTTLEFPMYTSTEPGSQAPAAARAKPLLPLAVPVADQANTIPHNHTASGSAEDSDSECQWTASGRQRR
jgi:hypothetical protein